MKKKVLAALANLFAIFLLSALVITPIYFAKNFSRVSGVKTQAQYLLVSQTDKFPQMRFSQDSDTYELTFKKQGSSQAYLGVFILNNPTNEAKLYEISVKSGLANVFFGEDIQNQQDKINVPPQASVPISMIATNSVISDQVVIFEID